MARYRTNFHRINFGFSPPLIQTADVVFDTEIPNDHDECLEEFEEAAWAEMWVQNPHWKNAKGPLSSGTGWSSVLGDNRYVKIG